MITDQLVIVRGGGDIATGVVQALRHAGFPVLILESDKPSAIRRTVALSEAVYAGKAVVEDITVHFARNLDEAEYLLFSDGIALMTDPEGRTIRDIIDTEEKYSYWDTGLTTLEGGGRHLFLTAVVDAVLAKKNLGTQIDMAPWVIALGPGFTAGKDCTAVVETMRGHNLGRLILEGRAAENTGVPGLIAGHSADRVIHSPAAGILHVRSEISDMVKEGQVIAQVENPADGSMTDVCASLTGVLRGLIRDGFEVPKGMKIADIDPRAGERENCFTISDKARCIGGTVAAYLTGCAARKAVDEKD